MNIILIFLNCTQFYRNIIDKSYTSFVDDTSSLITPSDILEGPKRGRIDQNVINGGQIDTEPCWIVVAGPKNTSLRNLSFAFLVWSLGVLYFYS